MMKKFVSLLAIFSVLDTVSAMAVGGNGLSTVDQVVTEDDSASVSSAPTINNAIEIGDIDFTEADAMLEDQEFIDSLKYEEDDDETQSNNTLQTDNNIASPNNLSAVSAAAVAVDNAKLDAKQQAYDDAKSNEQSLANRTLTAATTAATGIGAMELMQGLAEQKSDKDADKDMAAYIATFRCRYANGKQVKGGSEEIELPGGNNSNMMKYRSEYVALASDLKTRKEALGMTPGIETQEILDKSQMGLYDDENTGITNGAYASIYRTQMLNSESDQQQLDAEKQTSKNRVIGGAVAAGAGTIIGVGGNSLINGKLGDLIKDWKNNRTNTQQNNETIKALKKGLQSAGMKNVNKLDLSGFDMSALQSMVSNTDFSTLDLSGKDALTDINTSNPTSLASSLETLFGSK